MLSHRRGFRNLQILLKIAQKLQIGKDYERNNKNIFIMLQRGTNNMVNQVKTPMQNYFERVRSDGPTAL